MKNKLDNILQDWATRNEPAREHLEKLTRQITTEATRVRVYEEHAGSAVVPFGTKLSYAVFGAAVAFLTAFFCFNSLVSSQRSAADNSSAINLASIPMKHIENGKRLFNEMDRMFSDRLTWVCESNGDIGLGVESVAGGIDANSSHVLVRLVVVSRKTGEGAWRPVWNTDVLLRGEEMVEVAPNKNAQNKLALWVYPLNDGKLVVDTDLSLDMPVRIASRMNGVVAPGKPLEIISLRTDEAEYRVFQTVQIL